MPASMAARSFLTQSGSAAMLQQCLLCGTKPPRRVEYVVQFATGCELVICAISGSLLGSKFLYLKGRSRPLAASRVLGELLGAIPKSSRCGDDEDIPDRLIWKTISQLVEEHYPAIKAQSAAHDGWLFPRAFRRASFRRAVYRSVGSVLRGWTVRYPPTRVGCLLRCVLRGLGGYRANRPPPFAASGK